MTNERRDAEVLHNEGVWTEGNDIVKSADNISKLPLEDEDVKGQEYLYPVEMGVLNHRAELIEFKSMGSASGVKARHPHVHGVCTVVNGGAQHIPVPYGGEDLWWRGQLW
jgi:hypothetical protein